MAQRPSAREIFQSVLDRYQNSPSQWERAIQELCAGDERLACEVRELLEAYRSAQEEGFLERPARELLADIPERNAPTLSLGIDDTHLELVGPYRLKRFLGSGGFSSVYLAEQREPIHREVALKVFRWQGGPQAQSLIARFLQEREVLALMDHPNIARIYDGGVLPDGRPFYALELVRSGRPITKFCDDLRLSIADRLELFLQLCSAIQHAHQKGVIHRDLKPANVLAYEEDGQWRVKVIDFGLAKALQRRLGPQTVETMLGAFFGTPAYMPPEQAAGDPLRIDTRADIYSLGAILYELLTGLTPLELSEADRGLLGQVEIIRQREPIRPSHRVLQEPGAEERAARRGTTPAALASCLRGDLDWIVLKCLEKEPARRYPSVEVLMEDIARYRRHEPIVAAPPSWTYRMRKFARRYRGLLAAVGAVILALALGLVGSTWGFLESRRQAAEAERQRLHAEQARWAAENARIAAEKAAQAEQQARLEAERQQKEAEYQRQQAELERQKAVAAAAEAQAARQQAERRLTQFQRSLEILASLLAYLSPRSGEKKVLSLEKQLAEAASWAGHQLEKVSVEDPLAIAHLQLILGNTLLELGEFERAIEILEKVVSLRTEHLGISHPDTLSALHLLGKAYHTLGDILRALSLYERVRNCYQTEQVRFQPQEEIALLHDIAVGYHDAGRLPEALSLYRQLGERFSVTFGAHSVETLTALNNQALGYMEAGWFSEAISLLEQVVKLRTQILGEEHPDTLTSSVSLAVAYQECGRVSEAMDLLQRVLRVQQSHLGSVHPDTLVTLEHLACAYLSNQQPEDALRLLTQVVESKTSKFGAEGGETLGTLVNLAVAYHELGNLSEAITLLEKVSCEFPRTIGSGHPDTLLASYNLAIAYSHAGEEEKALLLCEKAAFGFEKIEFLHRCAGPTIKTLVRWYERMRKFSEADIWRYKWLAQTNELIQSEEEGTRERMQMWRSRWGLELMGPPRLGVPCLRSSEELSSVFFGVKHQMHGPVNQSGAFASLASSEADSRL